MKRLSPNSVLPEFPSEVMEYDDVFSDPLGTQAKETVHFGSRANPDNPDEICVMFMGTHSETFLRFHAASSEMDDLAGPRELIVALHPFAKEGDDVLARHVYPRGKPIDGFMTADGVDPLVLQWYWGIGQSGRLEKIARPPRVSFPSHRAVYVTQRRIEGNSSLQPMSLTVYATDDPAHGGEVAIPAPPAVTPVVDPAVPPTNEGGTFMQFGTKRYLAFELPEGE